MAWKASSRTFWPGLFNGWSMAFPSNGVSLEVRFFGPKLGFCGTSGKSALAGPIWPGIVLFSRHKNRKRWLVALSKAGPRWYIPLAPKGTARGRPLRKPPDRIDRRLRALAKFVSEIGFSIGQATVYRGV